MDLDVEYKNSGLEKSSPLLFIVDFDSPNMTKTAPTKVRFTLLFQI